MYHNNRPLWIFSFPFHFGLYLSIVYVVLVYLGALLGFADIAVAGDSSSVFGLIVYYMTLVFGLAGAVMAAFGALGLLLSRLFKYELRQASVWTDYFNVVLLFAVFGTTIWAWATVDPSFDTARAFAASLVTFSGGEPMPTLAGIHFTLAAFFMLWLPATHMTHFVGKYFTYHKVRWEDHPNLKGSDLEKSVTEALGNKITWGAPHIKSGGSWADAATAADTEEADNNG